MFTVKQDIKNFYIIWKIGTMKKRKQNNMWVTTTTFGDYKITYTITKN